MTEAFDKKKKWYQKTIVWVGMYVYSLILFFVVALPENRVRKMKSDADRKESKEIDYDNRELNEIRAYAGTYLEPYSPNAVIKNKDLTSSQSRDYDSIFQLSRCN